MKIPLTKLHCICTCLVCFDASESHLIRELNKNEIFLTRSTVTYRNSKLILQTKSYKKNFKKI